jgi:LAO/AO transport system kinase
MPTLAERVAAGDRRALAELISRIEGGEAEAREALARLHARTGRALSVGITGAPGSGKSTLVAALAARWRKGTGGEPPRTVGILAVDPTSPFSGGALLGDRIRMRDLAGDPGVFIRSMASRGHLGGLARSTEDAAAAVDAAGFDAVLIETVGVGQDEVEIAHRARTVVVVETPGLGDDIQALKAGLLEIADVLVVNKADLPGAEAAALSLQAMQELGAPAADGWQPPILKTVAVTGEGVDALADAIRSHQEHLRASGEGQRRERLQAEADLRERLRERLFDRWQSQARPDLVRWAARIAARECSLDEAVETLAIPPGSSPDRGT